MTYVNTGSVTAIGIIFPLLATIALSLRIQAWRLFSKTIQVDDILIIPSFLLTVAGGVAMVLGAQFHVVGSHSLPEVTPAAYRQLGMFEYAYFAGHVTTVGFIKLTILFFFRRIFKGKGMGPN
ncbi:hypothetical protein N0V93_004491 [Gnomoniopsis smithogilvyi]|uniref:Rhodopsin domain-containing protein n=1 Tax=Gnomoniopsis smithogilvyi TaxID=1191159 RepID=A0A9W8YR69_9PEZI|nr:hypothetical protein N0V93_004491 [Gnomoniopsis smithogilvyi]